MDSRPVSRFTDPMQYGATSASAVLTPLFAPRPMLIGMTGGTGFVGRALATRLVNAGHALRIATRSIARGDELLPLSSIEMRPGNVYDPTFLRRCFDGCDAVINLVGILNERGHGGAGFRRAHVEFTATVLKAMHDAHVPRLLHMSALNADAERGASHYLRSKGQAEQLIRSAGAVRWTIFRPSVIFGAEDSLTRRFAGLMRLTFGVLPLARAGARFAPIYVDDVAEAFARSLAEGAAVGATYELCGPEAVTLERIVRLTAQAARLPCHVIALPDAIGWLQGALMQFIPGKPFSLDNYHSLLTDSVCREDGCRALNIRPVSLELLAPRWLQPGAGA
jgi:uncharacterized protein YbjT (DUF2867 family)